MIEVVYTAEFEAWWEGLSEGQQDDVAAVVGVLEAKGVSLGFPYSSAIKGSKKGLRELRVQSAGRPLRTFYAFDPKRRAVLLLGGDKTGRKRFYEEEIPRAEAILVEYLREVRKERT